MATLTPVIAVCHTHLTTHSNNPSHSTLVPMTPHADPPPDDDGPMGQGKPAVVGVA